MPRAITLPDDYGDFILMGIDTEMMVNSRQPYFCGFADCQLLARFAEDCLSITDGDRVSAVLALPCDELILGKIRQAES